ncbi:MULTISPECIES: carbohydrate kinase [unclassified Microbacterium]|uniref:carbohydrate kinase family protein n=1 Tax=unclassified Microbacterium TaxID=2609290 RepID=UPI00365921F5
MTHPRIAVIGEALVDIVVGGAAHAGGSPMNVAVGLARLGRPPVLHARIGDDAYGDMIRAHLAADRVGVGADTLEAGESWTATATLAEDGSAEYEFALTGEITVPELDGLALVHTGSIGALREPGSSALLAAYRGAPDSTLRSFDPNIRVDVIGSADAARRRVFELAAVSHVVKLSDEDAAWLRPDAGVDEVLEELAAAGARFVAVTRGAQGVVALVDGVHYVRPALPVSVVDTIGAGDAFMSGLLFGLLRDGTDRLLVTGAPIPAENAVAALDTALASGAITVSRAGANPPHRAELEARLAATRDVSDGDDR